jgi:hypothetical protein
MARGGTLADFATAAQNFEDDGTTGEQPKRPVSCHAGARGTGGMLGDTIAMSLFLIGLACSARRGRRVRARAIAQ